MKKPQSLRWSDQTLLLTSNRGARWASVINQLKKSGWLVTLILLLAGISYAHETTYSVEQTIAVGSSPLTVVITPNGLEVYVSNYGSNTVSMISTKTDIVVATVPVGFGPDELAVSPDGSFVCWAARRRCERHQYGDKGGVHDFRRCTGS